MIKVTNLQEMNRIENGSLQMHIQKKAEAMMQEYQVENMDDIGCFVILEKEEFACVPMNRTRVCGSVGNRSRKLSAWCQNH